MGKGVGDDFRDGKVTLPVILALCARLARPSGRFWREAMAGGRSRRRGARPRRPACSRASGALDDTIARARTYGQRAIDALGPFPGGQGQGGAHRGGRVRGRAGLLSDALEIARPERSRGAPVMIPCQRPSTRSGRTDPRDRSPDPRRPAGPARRAARASNAVLVAPPGAGKTTAVAPALLGEPWCTGEILLLSPRRLAARAAAERMAELAGEPVGRDDRLRDPARHASARPRPGSRCSPRASSAAASRPIPSWPASRPCCSTRCTSAASTAISASPSRSTRRRRCGRTCGWSRCRRRSTARASPR